VESGKEITSPFGLLGRFEGDKVAYLQFLENSLGTAGLFKIWAGPRQGSVRPKHRVFSLR
jgi:hypothetical protein